jgi:hypothetical protein
MAQFIDLFSQLARQPPAIVPPQGWTSFVSSAVLTLLIDAFEASLDTDEAIHGDEAELLLWLIRSCFFLPHR